MLWCALFTVLLSNANQSCRLCTEAVQPFGGLANAGSALNIHVYLRSSAADCFFQVDCSAWQCHGYNEIQRRSDHFVVALVPLDEAGDAGLHGRIRTETHGLFE